MSENTQNFSEWVIYNLSKTMGCSKEEAIKTLTALDAVGMDKEAITDLIKTKLEDINKELVEFRKKDRVDKAFQLDVNDQSVVFGWSYSKTQVNTTTLAEEHFVDWVQSMVLQLHVGLSNISIPNAVNLAKLYFLTEYSKDQSIRESYLNEAVKAILAEHHITDLSGWVALVSNGRSFGVEGRYSYLPIDKGQFQYPAGSPLNKQNMSFVVSNTMIELTTCKNGKEFIEELTGIADGVVERHRNDIKKLIQISTAMTILINSLDANLVSGLVYLKLKDDLLNIPNPFEKVKESVNVLTKVTEDTCKTLELFGGAGKHECEDSECHLFTTCVGFEQWRSKEYCENDVINAGKLEEVCVVNSLGEVFRRTKPSYYGTKIQPIHLIQEQELNFTRGNAIKYICRAGKKLEAIDKPEEGTSEWRKEMRKAELLDLEKAKEYIDLELKYLRGLAE